MSPAITTPIVPSLALSDTLSPVDGRPSAALGDSLGSADAPTPKQWTRADRPIADPRMGKSGDEQRFWIRDQLVAIEKNRGKRLASTMDDYRRKVARLELRRDKNGVIPMAAFGNNRNTFAAMRAALAAVSVERAKAAFTEMSRADKAHRLAKAVGDSAQISLYKCRLEKAWHDLLVAGNDLARHPPGKPGQYVAAHSHFVAQRKEYRAAAPATRDLLLERPVAPAHGAWKTAVKNGEIVPSNSRSHGKRATTSRIQKKHPDWRNRVFDAVSSKWKTYTAIASVTGCRPEEIDGIEFFLDPSDPSFLTFVIRGAKYDKKKKQGIEVRTFTVRERESRAFDYLMTMAAVGRVTVAPPQKGSAAVASLTDVNAAFRNAINQAGRTFLKRIKNPLTLSPYCFRHSFAADIKASEHTTTSLAIALGHSTTKTQSQYGRANDGNRGMRELKVYEIHYEIRNPLPSRMVARAHEVSPALQESGTTYSEAQYIRLQRHSKEKNAEPSAAIADGPFTDFRQ